MGRVTRIVKAEKWWVQRIATVTEVELTNGQIRFNVLLQDVGRKPFVSRWFNDPSPAYDFLESLVPQEEPT